MKHISNLITTDSSRQYNIERLCEYTIKDESVIKRTFLDIAGRFVGGHYRITEDNRKIINELLMYFTGNGNLNLRKGIYIYGDFGTGKSVMMQAIRKTLAKIFPFNLNGFGNTSIEQIIEHYKFENNLHKFGYNDGKPVKVMDRGRVIRGNRLDVFFNSHRRAKRWGTKYLNVKVRKY